MGAQYEKKLNRAIDEIDSVYFLTFLNQAWLSIPLDIIGVVLTLITALLVITNRFNLNPSTAGLILTYMVQFMIKQLTEVENSMNSTERIYHYGSGLPQEANVVGEAETPSPSWPEAGEIKFNKVEMRYRDGLPLTLKGLDLQVKGGVRIGVVGRTGAGKSSIMSCLFRLIELSGGSIKIDGFDISKVQLPLLRSRLSIIPQGELHTLQTHLRVLIIGPQILLCAAELCAATSIPSMSTTRSNFGTLFNNPTLFLRRSKPLRGHQPPSMKKQIGRFRRQWQ